MDFGSRHVLGCLTDLRLVKTETLQQKARSKRKTGKQFDGGSFAVQCTWWEVVLFWVCSHWLHLCQVTIPSRVFNEEMEGPDDRVDEQVQTNAVDERFEESCRYIDEMSYSQQASEIGVRLDGHALIIQVCHRTPSVPGAATWRKKIHRDNNRTQLTSQDLSYFVTTMHLLLYRHLHVILFVCDNFSAGTGSVMLSKIKTSKEPRVSLCGETSRSA